MDGLSFLGNIFLFSTIIVEMHIVSKSMIIIIITIMLLLYLGVYNI
jgi:hypothetical protein